MGNDTNITDMITDPTALQQLGLAIGAAIAHNNNTSAGRQYGYPTYKEANLTLGDVSIYGRNSIFSPCSPGDVFGLQVQTHGLMNWLGWKPNKYYSKRIDFITYMGPAGTAEGSPASSAIGPCEDPPGWEYGSCGYNLIHKSWYGQSGQALDPHTIVQDRCETTPRYRVNGQIITDDVEWQVNGMMHVLNQSIRRDIIHGNHSNPNEMNGLENIIKTGHTDDEGHACPMVDSILVSWGSDDLDGAVNGYGNFFNYLDEVITEIEWRASAIGTIDETDMAIITSRFMATGLLDAYACYTTCGVTSTSDITDQALRAEQRNARRSLNGGPLYDGRVAVGYIPLKSGRRIPIIVEDSLDISRGSATTYCNDMYVLVRNIGTMEVLSGTYLDLRVWEQKIAKNMDGFTGRTDAAGRFAMKSKEDNFCVQAIIGTSPELFLSAPWAQVRISDVCVSRNRKPLTGDPYQTEYLPGGPSGLYPAYTYNTGLSE